MTPAAKAFSITLVAVVVSILIFVFMPSGHFLSSPSVTCEEIYWWEVRLIDEALKVCALADKPFPSLDELVAQGLYTLPQDRKEWGGSYPIDQRNLRVKLYSMYHPHIANARRVIVTSTKGKCKNGNTLVASSLNSPRELWFESRLTH